MRFCSSIVATKSVRTLPGKLPPHRSEKAIGLNHPLCLPALKRLPSQYGPPWKLPNHSSIEIWAFACQSVSVRVKNDEQ